MTYHTLHQGCGGELTIETWRTLLRGWIVAAIRCDKCNLLRITRTRARPQKEE